MRYLVTNLVIALVILESLIWVGYIHMPWSILIGMVLGLAGGDIAARQANNRDRRKNEQAMAKDKGPSLDV